MLFKKWFSIARKIHLKLLENQSPQKKSTRANDKFKLHAEALLEIRHIKEIKLVSTQMTRIHQFISTLDEKEWSWRTPDQIFHLAATPGGNRLVNDFDLHIRNKVIPFMRDCKEFKGKNISLMLHNLSKTKLACRDEVMAILVDKISPQITASMQAKDISISLNAISKMAKPSLTIMNELAASIPGVAKGMNAQDISLCLNVLAKMESVENVKAMLSLARVIPTVSDMIPQHISTCLYALSKMNLVPIVEKAMLSIAQQLPRHAPKMTIQQTLIPCGTWKNGFSRPSKKSLL